MADIELLKKSLFDLIENSNCTFADIVNILDPFANYVNNTLFTDNMEQLVNIIIIDRNHDQKISFDDIKLLSSDIGAITSIISCTLAIIASLPTVELKSGEGFAQDVLFKILAYIFLVVLPQKLNLEWSVAEKKTIVNIVLTIYNLFVTSGLAKNLINKIKQLFIKKGWCKCICAPEVDKQEVLSKQLPLMMFELGTNLSSFRNMSNLRQK